MKVSGWLKCRNYIGTPPFCLKRKAVTWLKISITFLIPIAAMQRDILGRKSYSMSWRGCIRASYLNLSPTCYRVLSHVCVRVSLVYK